MIVNIFDRTYSVIIMHRKVIVLSVNCYFSQFLTFNVVFPWGAIHGALANGHSKPSVLHTLYKIKFVKTFFLNSPRRKSKSHTYCT